MAGLGRLRVLKSGRQQGSCGVQTLRSTPLSFMSGGRVSEARKRRVHGGVEALNVSQNASGWMLRKGYAVNGVAHIKHYESVTDACETEDEGVACVKVSHSCASYDLPINCMLMCDVRRPLFGGVCLTARSQNVRGVYV